MVTMCASGKNEDCGGVSHYTKCCDYEGATEDWGISRFTGPNKDGPVAKYVKGSGGNCGWRYGKYGEYVKCQNGQVAKGMCASGMYRDCAIKSGRQYPGEDPYWWGNKYYNYNAIYCCDM